MKGDAYSHLKALRHLDVIDGVRNGLPVRPVHVQIILSDLCNHSCAFCSYRDPGYSSSQLFYEVDAEHLRKGLRRDQAHPERNYNPNRMIPFEKALEILDDCAELGVRAIQYTGGGEPTVHPRFGDVLRETRRRGLAYAVVSNGVNIARKGLAEEVALGDWTRISIDAGRAETYARIRGVDQSHFDDAWRAIVEIRRARERFGSPCVIGVGFVVTPDNWREVLEATRRARDAGADNIRISAQFSQQDGALFHSFATECGDLCREAKRLGASGFAVYNRFSARLGDLVLGRPDYDLCGYQHLTTYIGGDLNVYRCCVQSYNPNGLLGSLKEQRFRDLWMSDERARGMAEFSARSCERCQFNGINRVLSYVLGGEQLHEDFV